MMLARETVAQDEEEGVEEEEVAKSVGAASVGSTRNHFAASYTTLHRIDFLLIAPIT